MVLFDIDGTLIHCGRAPKNAFVKALNGIFGSAGIANKYNFSGKTDPQIAFDVMTRSGFDGKEVEERTPEILDLYLKDLHKTLRFEDMEVQPGIEVLLTSLSDDPAVVVGLLTGNIERGADLKLSRAGLVDFFKVNGSVFGAFGSDSMDRNDLPEIAADKAERLFDKKFAGKEIVVIGDSIYDVLCGKSLNVKSIAVETGWTSGDELKLHEPDHFFTDLSDTKKVLTAILA